jgi:histidinol phosphatase-like enzyme
MQNDSLGTLQLTLTRDEGVGRVSVPLEDFLGFDLWMTHSLEQIVTQWSETTPIRATRSGDLDYYNPHR